jgi:M6 family metalloprotease-like protein
MEEEMQENARTLQSIHETHGFIRVLIVLVQFPDHADRKLPNKKDYEELFNGDEESDIIPTGSIKQWLAANSYGKMQIEAEVADWTITDDTEFYYSFGKSGVTIEFRRSMYPALDRLESEGFDFSRFDLNDDGIIDNIVLLHSGYAAEIGGVDCY